MDTKITQDLIDIYNIEKEMGVLNSMLKKKRSKLIEDVYTYSSSYKYLTEPIVNDKSFTKEKSKKHRSFFAVSDDNGGDSGLEYLLPKYKSVENGNGEIPKIKAYTNLYVVNQLDNISKEMKKIGKILSKEITLASSKNNKIDDECENSSINTVNMYESM